MNGSAAVARQAAFRRSTVLWLSLASLLAAAGFFLLSTYAPDLRIHGASGPSPLSRSAVGYLGLRRLLTLAGTETGTVHSATGIESDALLIVTLEPDTNRAALARLVEARKSRPTLFILPKWWTQPLPDHDGWVARLARMQPPLVKPLLDRIATAGIGTGEGGREVVLAGHRTAAPDSLQWLEGLEPFATDSLGHTVVGGVPGRLHYVLGDPDLANNAGLKDPATARAALALIELLRPGVDMPVLFDLTLHGAGEGNELAKLLVEPPFLALTLTVLAAAALAVLHGLGRFGPARSEGRAFAFGKTALVDTTARLMRRAGRLSGLGPRYAAAVRHRAAAELGAPAGLSDSALDIWLGRRRAGGPDEFARLVAAAGRAGSEREMHQAALALHDWQERRLRDR